MNPVTLFALLFHAWLSEPFRAAAGIVGGICFVWSVIPLATRPGSPLPLRVDHPGDNLRRLRDFAGSLGDSWRTDPIRAATGIAGAALFLWSAAPIATVR